MALFVYKKNSMRKLIDPEAKNCRYCPFAKTERTQGAGYAEDYYCIAKSSPLGLFSANKTSQSKSTSVSNIRIAGYVEWDSDLPTPPEWCPLKVNDKVLATLIQALGFKQAKALLLTSEDEYLREFAKDMEDETEE